jgi:hypothetical protein
VVVVALTLPGPKSRLVEVSRFTELYTEGRAHLYE